MKKRLAIVLFLVMMTASCKNNFEKGVSQNYNMHISNLKSENSLKITMGETPVTIVGKELKTGDRISEVPLTVNSKLEDKNIFDDDAVKVLYTAPSLDTRVCSLQTRQLDNAARKYKDVRFYSITMDTPLAQENFCTSNEINGLKAVSDFKYHQFGLQNGLLVKESGLLTRALIILDRNNTVKYIEYVPEQGKEADIDKALKFLEESVIPSAKGMIRSSDSKIPKKYTDYLDSLKAENSLKATREGKPVTIVGKELKAGDRISEVPLTVNTKLEERNIFSGRKLKVIYTTLSLEGKVCSLQVKMLDEAAKNYPDISFYAVTNDLPFAQKRRMEDGKITHLQAVSDFKYHQFGLQNGLFLKETGQLARALIILDENNTVKYIDYAEEEKEGLDIKKGIEQLKKLI